MTTKYALMHIGKLTREDEAAIQSFQRAFGAQIDGEIGHQTWSLILTRLADLERLVKARDATILVLNGRCKDLVEDIGDLQAKLDACDRDNPVENEEFVDGLESRIERLMRENRVLRDSLGTAKLAAWTCLFLLLGMGIWTVLAWN